MTTPSKEARAAAAQVHEQIAKGFLVGLALELAFHRFQLEERERWAALVEEAYLEGYAEVGKPEHACMMWGDSEARQALKEPTQ